MISARTLTITGIVIVLLCAGLFFYTEHRNQKFAEQLPTPQSKQVDTEAILNDTPEAMDGTTSNSPFWQTDQGQNETTKIDPSAADIQRHSDTTKSNATQKVTELGTEEVLSLSQAEIDTIFDDAFAFFDEFSVFDSINIGAIRAELAEMLRELHGNEPRVSEFLGHWDTTSRVLALRAEYNKTGRIDADLREQIFEMKPTEVVPKAFELGVELIQPSETVVTRRREWLQDWVELVDKAEVAHYAGTLAREAFSRGEITVQEAESFIEDVSGADVTVREKKQ
jgi:hypothetical protein